MEIKPKTQLKAWHMWGIFLTLTFFIYLFGRSYDEKAAEEYAAKNKKSEVELRPHSGSSVEVTPELISAADIDAALKGFRSEKDEFQSLTFYHDKGQPKYIDVNALFMYLGRSGDTVYPRIKIQYAGDDWIFIEQYRFVVDGETFVLEPDEQIVRDNSGGKVWEYLDQNPSDNQLNLMRVIASSKSAKMRYEGKERVFDRKITEKEKASIARTLAALDKIAP